MINVRLVAVGQRPRVKLPQAALDDRSPRAALRRSVYLGGTDMPVDCPIYEREALPSGGEVRGPALIQEYASTTVLFEGDQCVVASTGELLIKVRSAS